ncbi:AzlD domain-containing protein [Pseudomonas sp. CCM 7891]|uniref:AzlD domain-containing protein n=1 Tax=Pseudomonas karstica TaxID=1055468 RepID=A0A7X2UXQ3_9PSED|nr:AzlD domain-containing protein [Pseudomonas karstica]MTD19304.1 AzlD domain-containing protein [Pseudomonas karstica]
MTIEATGWGTFVAIFIMALVTLATRWGGIFIMGFVPISYRVQQFINAMSGSVLVAVLTPLAVEGDNGARMALFITAIVMLVLKKPLPAIAAGVVAAAVYRSVVSGSV